MSLTIFIVDDDAKVLRSLERLLQKDICVLKTFQSSVEALTAMETEQPRIVISDRKMPHMDGTDLLRRVKERYPDIVCILTSGHPISDTDKNALETGEIDHYFSKPLDIELFLSEIRRLINADSTGAEQ